MTTRNLKGKKSPLRGTEFQLHKTQLSIFSNIQSKIIDFTECRLNKYISDSTNTDEKNTLVELLKKYKKGNVAISWRDGIPYWINVIKECLCTEIRLILQYLHAR